MDDSIGADDFAVWLKKAGLPAARYLGEWGRMLDRDLERDPQPPDEPTPVTCWGDCDECRKPSDAPCPEAGD